MKSPVKADETVTLFSTAGWPSKNAANQWDVEIRGVIFEEEKRPLVAAAFRKVLAIEENELSTAEKSILDSRVALFLVDNERGKEIPILAGEQPVRLPKSSPGGHFGEVIQVPHAVSTKPGDRLPLKVILPSGDDRTFTGSVCLMPDNDQPLIISDIDDTIKVTEVTNRAEAKRNTFCRPFREVDGMAGAYQNWAQHGAGFFYVSGSPWQLYRPLEAFRESSGFPAGSWHLKHVRLLDPTTIVALFGPQNEYKLSAIEPLLERWSRRPVILVGDSGEQDPEIYGELARRHPGRISRIFIRRVTEDARDSARYRQAFTGVSDERWSLFERGGDLPAALK